MALDFLIVSTRSSKKGLEVYPRFKINRSSDLMIRGGDFYAIWVEQEQMWSTDEQIALQLIDKELDEYVEKNKAHFDSPYKVLYMWDAETGMIDTWHRYCQKQLRDNFTILDEELIFSNTVVKKQDYASKRLSYPLTDGPINAWDRLLSVLYSEKERHKIEWSIGAIVSGESRYLQKFVVLYGSAGTGKSTILNIVQQLFSGYYSVFDAKALGSSSNSFALEAFKNNPLVAIQHDGDLSRIEDNTRLNSLVSHELMTVNEKFKSTYASQFKCFLYMGTNKPVKITDAKSGLIRRLIDVTPTGDKLAPSEYRKLMDQIKFELGPIAFHCRNIYLDDPHYYDDYIPIAMMGASNDFYNFVMDAYTSFSRDDGTSLKIAWEMYKTYCDDAKVGYPLTLRAFKEELKNYFREYYERFTKDDGTRVRNYYQCFRADKFEDEPVYVEAPAESEYSIQFESTESIFDTECSDCIAQYGNSDEHPTKKWCNVTTKLSDLDTSKLHYVRVPENHIVIDFDIKDETGAKSLPLNLKAASKFPQTYAELSKGGSGIHLHYIYDGDVTRLSRVYDTDIEVKVFTGNSSLRRRLSKCNNLPIATISSGLPLKETKTMVNFDAVKSEKGLRVLISRNLYKEIHPGTKPSVDFIYKILEDAYKSGLRYDVSDMYNAVLSFAAGSTNHSEYCIQLVSKMKFKSDEPSEPTECSDNELVFYDIEVFPNLFLVNFKSQGKGKPIVRLINPAPAEIEKLIKFRLIGFNCRRYDNHLIYARMLGYTNEQLYHLSQRIVSGDRSAFFGEAYNISYTDVYDFASAGNKKSLKKLEIDMGIHHQELGLPWDQPVPEELWNTVAEYCDNDVIATEAAFEYLSADWTARMILSDLAGMSCNSTTNSLTTKIIFGSNKKPQSQFCYRNLAEPVYSLEPDVDEFLHKACPEMMAKRHGPANSLLPYFPGYTYDIYKKESTYRGEVVGEGGYVYAEPEMYGNVALLDIASMHPHSTIAETLFGSKYTNVFRDLVNCRVYIKHEDWDTVEQMAGGLLVPYVQKVKNGEMTSKQLANALKTAINSVYGLTDAGFDNPFKDQRNVDNIVAKRGALFMIDLKHEVQERGFTVAHIKTDSIKIPDATPEIIEFVMTYGKEHGYTFEHEATYDRMCLVNNAVYIAKYASGEKCEKLYGYIPGDNASHGGEWTATGTQFQIPYVFKTLFSKEPIEFSDMCETKSVTSSIYLDMNEDLPDVSDSEKEYAALCKNGETSKTLEELIAKGHDYHFVGKVGQFCPIKPGYGGGLLVRETQNNKTGAKGYSSVTGAKGYRWLESEAVSRMNDQSCIDDSYYRRLTDDAVDTINEIAKTGDFEWFISDEEYVPGILDCPF